MRECSTFPLHHVRPGKEAIDTECGTICHIVTAPSSSLSLFLCLSHTSSTDRIMWAASSYYPFFLSLFRSLSPSPMSLSLLKCHVTSKAPDVSVPLQEQSSSPFLLSSPFISFSLLSSFPHFLSFPPFLSFPTVLIFSLSFILSLKEVFSSILLDYLTGISGRRTMVSLLLAGGSISQHMVAQRGGMQ